MNFGIAPIAAIVVSVIVDMVQSGIQANIAASNAAAEYHYFKDIEDNDFMQMALELQKKIPIYDYKKWFYILKQLKTYGLIESPRPDGVLPITVITPPEDENSQGQPEPETDYTKYIPWMAMALVLIVIARS